MSVISGHEYFQVYKQPAGKFCLNFTSTYRAKLTLFWTTGYRRHSGVDLISVYACMFISKLHKTKIIVDAEKIAIRNISKLIKNLWESF